MLTQSLYQIRVEGILDLAWSEWLDEMTIYREAGDLTLLYGPVRRRAALPNPLSEREIETLRLLGQGLTNREIAQRLSISPGTVNVHLKHIFNKLDADNRTAAVVVRARKLSLI